MENKLAKIRLGILGGGQLARMLALKSHELGVKPYIFSASTTDPAVPVSFYHKKGLLNSTTHLKQFLQKVDLAIFENEFVTAKLLQKITQEIPTPIYPSPQVMSLLQDRWQQKQLLSSYKIPTAHYINIKPHVSWGSLSHTFPQGMVLKKRLCGYDGYGTYIVRSFAKNLLGKKFINDHQQNLIAEEFIPFKREMAIILVRNQQRQIIELPLVETYQKQACCVWVKGPCTHPKKNQLVKKLKHMLHKINYKGVIAFELFETQKGDLLVNELAPRVHNSGHYSLNALSEDQFSLHIKAVLNFNITSPTLHTKGFAMLNLLGQNTNKTHNIKNTRFINKPQALSTILGYKNQSKSLKKHTKSYPIYLHWYGKTPSRPGRKMGHLNSLANTANTALNQLLQFQKKFL